jgi:excisionase family DNA binding protein
MSTLLNISQSSHYLSITKAAIYRAIKENKVKFEKNGSQYFLSKKHLDEYANHKWDRARSKINGYPLYDIEKGTYDIRSASEVFRVGKQALYYAIRKGLLHSKRVRCSHILLEDDILNFLEKRKLS